MKNAKLQHQPTEARPGSAMMEPIPDEGSDKFTTEDTEKTDMGKDHYTFHEIADKLPMMDAGGLKALAEDIRANGQRLPIILHEGKILDGRNRYKACQIAGVEPRFEELPDGVDPWVFVGSMNIERRHMSTSQLAMWADAYREHLEVEAKKRMSAGGGDKKSQKAKESGVETLPPPIDSGKSRDQAGKLVGVSGRTMDRAKKVREQGHKALVEAVEAGKIDVTNAAKIAELPKDVQETVLEDAERNQWSGRQMKQEAERLVQKKGVAAASGIGTSGRPHPIRMGLQYAGMAIAQLEKIAKRDKERAQALDKVTNWIKENR